MSRKSKISFGSRVKTHREDVLGYSLRQAADDTGISAATLSRVENGKAPDIFTFAKLCRWLGYSEAQALIDLGA